MQVLPCIVQRIAVDMVNDLPRLGLGDLAMLPSSTAPAASISQPLCLKVGGVRLVRLLDRRKAGAYSFQRRSGRRHHLVSAPHVLASSHAINLLAVREERIAMSMPHLVMPNAKFASRHGSIAVKAFPTNFLAAPSVFGRSVLLNALVVHQAKTVSCVLATTAFNRTKNHTKPFQMNCPNSIRYKALGNSWAVPNVRWIGERIQAVDAILNSAREAA